MNADLHSHSTVSDGLLSPADVVARACANGVELLALTDHDELDGLASAQAAARQCGLRFVPGVEVSVSWGEQTVHIVALGVDPAHAGLRAGLEQIRSGRGLRARRIASELERIGFAAPYEGAARHAENPDLISRSHFARYLVEQGAARDAASVFDHYLAYGKPGYVPHEWASLELALDWIHAAGGLAVLAHPGRYRLSGAEMSALLARFKDLGGEAIEVVSGSHDAALTQHYARVARRYGFLASRASDFHGPGESRIDLGRAPALPPDLPPVWSRLV